MNSVIKADWVDNMTFDALVDGHHITLDTTPEFGGNNKGPRPKVLMMVALAGCTGMDVVSILKKMKVDIQKVQIVVEGTAKDDHPKKYTHMKVIYKFMGNNLEMEKLQKAVKLSEEKYCSVNAVYKDVIKMEYEIQIVNTLL